MLQKALFFIFLLLFSQACISDTNFHIKKPAFTKTLYLSKSLNDLEIFLIVAAAENWYKATNGIVDFNYELDYDLKDNYKLNLKKDVVVVPISNTHQFIEDITALLKIHHKTDNIKLMGYDYKSEDGKPEYLLIVYNNIENVDEYYKSIVHELGHILNLNHTENTGIPYKMSDDEFYIKNPSIMVDNIFYSPACITAIDIQQFCKIYECSDNIFTPCQPEKL